MGAGDFFKHETKIDPEVKPSPQQQYQDFIKGKGRAGQEYLKQDELGLRVEETKRSR